MFFLCQARHVVMPINQWQYLNGPVSQSAVTHALHLHARPACSSATRGCLSSVELWSNLLSAALNRQQTKCDEFTGVIGRPINQPAEPTLI